MRETEQTLYVIRCTGCGAPLQESEECKSRMVCPECGKITRVIAKRGKVVLIDDDGADKTMSPLLRSWYRIRGSKFGDTK